MLTKATVKLIQSLSDKKSRSEHGLFLVEGTKAVNELLVSKIHVKSLFATADWLNSHQSIVKNVAECTMINDRELKQISNLVTPHEVIAMVEIPVYEIEKIKWNDAFSIALDTIQDPGNMGTIIRIADWYGIENIVCSHTCADVFNPKVIQATMGSFIRVKVFYTDLEEFFGQHKIGNVYGAMMEGDDLYKTSLTKNGILLIGNEGSGISKNVIKYITKPITIKRRGGAESLNAAVAAGIICDAWARGGK